ncbi:PhoX family phosphatase [Tsukamurella sp. 8F]|uniref:PhoX family protein n=1 Tax=unclassified Tsukamurella TaxID=2633480 RepID=UPI0023B90FE4|nr:MULTISPECIES: PhoX family phosphatase [unclassified Tsukamurella]MDF0529441.1 PhoX family phosphatase [Tsukamurella sp. 8J]MDF0589350.1 PhoX family phosphatase [Tsukamurella sp. 8F]
MALPVLRLLPVYDAGRRSHTTCKYKCGEQCFRPEDNTSDNEYFGDIVASISRRTALRGAGVAVLGIGAASALAACDSGAGTDGSVGASSTGASGAPGTGNVPNAPGLVFDAVAPNTKDAVTIPDGYEQAVVIRWGDPVEPGAPKFNAHNQTPEAQAKQFGFNNDFAGLIPVDGRPGSYLLVCNQEYTTGTQMFYGYREGAPTENQVRVEMAAHGLTVVELKGETGSGRLTPVIGDTNRRVTASTPFELRGPAAGTVFTRTKADPAGNRVLGTIANCSGGITPWGTMLSGEENYTNYFSGAQNPPVEGLKEGWKRYGVGKDEDYHKWGLFEDRFDLAKEPNEVNRFGYIVELNPHDPHSIPVKHSALGRLKHEGSNIYVTPAGDVVAYTGDDSKFEYIYKFVSSRRIQRGPGAAAMTSNMRILDEGTLYVAKLSGAAPNEGEVPTGGYRGKGRWIPLLTVREDGSAQSHVDGMPAENVAVFTRVAADKAGATKMDRPEDIEPNPKTGKVYCALTNNSDRGADGKAGIDAANPRTKNKSGQIIEITDDHTGTEFSWDLLLVCGDPAAADTYYGGFDKSRVSRISCPDNVAFDSHGNLWISTDGTADVFDTNDGLFGVVLDGAERGLTKQFLTVPFGAETCGPIVTDERIMVCVQHPGETDDATAEKPASHWPDGGDSLPRPAVVAVWRTDGRIGT